MTSTTHNFTKYEMARIIGARALQIAMDAPLLLKISESELRVMKFDALKMAEKEFKENVLPISIIRPSPLKTKEKLSNTKEDPYSPGPPFTAPYEHTLIVLTTIKPK